jgi:hypothetical protein
MIKSNISKTKPNRKSMKVRKWDILQRVSELFKRAKVLIMVEVPSQSWEVERTTLLKEMKIQH